MKPLISIVIPAYNEEAVIPELGKRLRAVMAATPKYDFEAIIVENGSQDGSWQQLQTLATQDPRFRIVQLSRNFGCDGGISAGLAYTHGAATVIMNADLQDPPELIPQFLEKWEQGYEIVYGVIKKRYGVSPFRRITATLFYQTMHWLTGGSFPKHVSDFRLIDKKVNAVINGLQEKNRFLRGMIIWVGFKQIGVEYERPPRFAGESKAPLGDIARTAANGLYSFSFLPLKIATGLGLFLSGGSFIAIFGYLFSYFKYGREVPGFTTLITIILFMFGMLFLVLGMMGEYLARIYDEVRGRPNFIVKNVINDPASRP